MDAEEGFEVGLICGELIDALKAMVACDDLVWGSKGGEELMGELMAFGGYTDLDSPRSPRETTNALTPTFFASWMIGTKWERPMP